MNKKWILPLLAFLLTACPVGKENGISAINATATPTTITSAGSSSLNATVIGTGTFNQSVNWSVISGGGTLSSDTGTNVTYTAPTVTSQTAVQIKATAAGDTKFSQTLAVTVTAKPNPGGAIFTPTNAWSGDIPSDAQTLSSDEFTKGIESGELVLSSTALVEGQKQTRETSYQQDLTLLNNIANKDPDTQTLLEETASSPKFEGDLPVVQPNGETVVLFGLGTQVDNAAQAYQRSQSVENALSDYTLSYSLLTDDLKAQAPTRESLNGKSLAEVKAALKQINDLLGTTPTALKAARLEPNIGIQPRAINPGNGTDNNGPCSPTNLVKRYWFPLKNFISPIKDQAKRGACWDFAAIGAVESRERVQNNNAVNLSEQFLMNKVKQD